MDDNEMNDRRYNKRKLCVIIVVALVIFVIGISTIHIGGSKTTSQSIQNGNSASSTPSAGASPSSSPSESSIDLSTYDWSKLKGEKLSNAYKLAKHDGVEITDVDLEIITSDGKQVINPANWSITDISFTAPNKLLIHANHDTKSDSGFSSGTIGSVINDTLAKL